MPKPFLKKIWQRCASNIHPWSLAVTQHKVDFNIALKWLNMLKLSKSLRKPCLQEVHILKSRPTRNFPQIFKLKHTTWIQIEFQLLLPVKLGCLLSGRTLGVRTFWYCWQIIFYKKNMHSLYYHIMIYTCMIILSWL